ncbi:MAG: hypothetical protein KF889_01490 [Alphaproteobacteria bacterium]|nr:hypothetical protein [Alphaproteobacteria bacterium]MCW5741576.1 hypothetical protein [Alphaproteobacteria bacterium]
MSTDPTKGTQIERIKAKLARDGYVTRNECLRQFPAITRLAARIQDLEDKHGYVFLKDDTGRDCTYKLVHINGVPPEKSALVDADHRRIAREAVEAFDAD